MDCDNIYIKIEPKQTPEPESFDQKEVYAFFGLTSYSAQCLEKALVNLAFTYSLTDKNIVTQEEWDALFADINKNTFGRLLGMVKKELSTSDEVLAELKQTLDRRNWLAHDYLFDSIYQFIEGIYLHIWQQHGLTEETISREIEKLKEENADQSNNAVGY